MVTDYNYKEIKCLNDLFDFLKVTTLDSERERFYRGVNFSHEIKADVPKLARDGYESLREKESTIIHETMTYRPQYFSECKTAIEILELMQHYGFPTRLLDITTNPLVALYFACIGKEDKDGQINYYDIDKKNIKFNDSDTVSVLANFAFMPEDFCLRKSRNNKIDYNDNNYQKLIHQIRNEKSYFEGKIFSEHFQGYIVCVKPKVNNPRILAQEGAFLLFGDIYDIFANDNMNKRYMYRRFTNLNEKVNLGSIKWNRLIIPKDYKSKLLEELGRIGVNEQKLFPELEFFAKQYVPKTK